MSILPALAEPRAGSVYGIDKAELKNFAGWIQHFNACPAVASGLNVGKDAPLNLANDQRRLEGVV
ncbi:MAG: hypothetical protein MO846_11855 [Candidatus Devosia symbiotica]|nr:hypothetical protein [Candidatus Devosia symbiotica]